MALLTLTTLTNIRRKKIDPYVGDCGEAGGA